MECCTHHVVHTQNANNDLMLNVMLPLMVVCGRPSTALVDVPFFYISLSSTRVLSYQRHSCGIQDKIIMFQIHVSMAHLSPPFSGH